MNHWDMMFFAIAAWAITTMIVVWTGRIMRVVRCVRDGRKREASRNVDVLQERRWVKKSRCLSCSAMGLWIPVETFARLCKACRACGRDYVWRKPVPTST